MKVSQKIEAQLKGIPEGITFGYKDMAIETDEFGAASKSIERIIAAGKLKRISKGVFYKPRMTVFGLVQPVEQELLKQYLFKNGRRVAYITGIGLYNQMGLTTQIPAIIIMASKSRRKAVDIGNIKIKPVKSYTNVTNENYKLLGILDAVKDFKTIPDTDIKSVISILKNQLNQLTEAERKYLTQYALDYPPRVRALLGAILEIVDNSLDLIELKKSLSPLSTYKTGITTALLPNAIKWNLK